MRIYAHGVEPGVMEIYARLPLADTDDVLAVRMDELLVASGKVGF
jgi:hypothetical protein